MKTISKILAILIVSLTVFVAMPSNMCFADGNSALSAIDDVKNKSNTVAATKAASDMATVVGQILGFLQIASGIIAVLMIAIGGITYIVETPEAKEGIKKKLIPIIIGLVLVFGATSIAKFFVGIVG